MKKQQPYTASVTIYGKTTTAEGKTVREAVENLKPSNAKGKAILVVRHGNVSRERILTAYMASRLFNLRGMTREVALKNISLMFEGV